MADRSGELKEELLCSCKEFSHDCSATIKESCLGQHPSIAVLCCSDSRVPPELIFKKTVGELFVVRVAGNVAVDTSVIFSLEYAVEHLGVDMLLVLGHSGCGAVAASEVCNCAENEILAEIQNSFELHDDHCVSNLMRQVELLPQRSKIISEALEKGDLVLTGALYHIEDGGLEYLF